MLVAVDLDFSMISQDMLYRRVNTQWQLVNIVMSIEAHSTQGEGKLMYVPIFFPLTCLERANYQADSNQDNQDIWR